MKLKFFYNKNRSRKMARLNREKMDESYDSIQLRQFMKRHNLSLWQMARLMKIPSYLMCSILLGESFLDAEDELQFERTRLELLWGEGQ